MVLTAKMVLDYAVRHKIGGPISAYIPDLDVVNRALLEFSGLHSWRCMVRNAVDLRVQPAVTLASGAYWTESLSLLYDSNAGSPFSTYLFVDGDTAEVTVSGEYLATYRVTSRVSNDGITLDATLGADNTSGVLGFTLDTSRIALPDDLGEIIKVEASNTLNRRFRMVDPVELLNLRSQPNPKGSLTTWGALHYAQSSQGVGIAKRSEPVPVLEVWPRPTAVDAQRFSVTYRAKPLEVTDEDDVINLPDYAHGLILDLAAAVAQAYEAKSPVGMYVDQVLASSTFIRTKRQDGLIVRAVGIPRYTAYGVLEDKISYTRALAESGDITNNPS